MRKVFSTTLSLSLKKEKFALHQGLGENVCQLLICRNILELDCSPQHPIIDEMIYDLDVLQPIMKHMIL
jgi:hypothetical protein